MVNFTTCCTLRQTGKLYHSRRVREEIDPRPAKPWNANTRHLDLLLKHRHFFERWLNGRAKDIRVVYKEAITDLTDQVSQMMKRWGTQEIPPMPMQRLLEMEAQIAAMQERLEILEAYTKEQIEQGLTDATGMEWNAAGKRLDKTTPTAIEINTGAVPDDLVEQILNEPTKGKSWIERVQAGLGETEIDLRKELAIIALTGESIDVAVRRLSAIWDIGARRIETILRTELLRAANAANYAMYQQNLDVIQGVTWMATLDDRTCLVCGVRDGQSWRYGDNGELEYTNENGYSLDGPPLHPNCRCVVNPWLKSWEDITGVEGVDAPAGSRASMDGEVPATMTYNDWLNDLKTRGELGTLEDILGPQRAERFMAGAIKLPSMVNNGRVLSLDEYAALTD